MAVSKKEDVKEEVKTTKSTKTTKKESNVSLEDIQKQMAEMMALIQSKDKEIEELKSKNNRQISNDIENEYIEVKSVINAPLCVKTKDNEYIFNNEGETDRIRFNELRSLKNAHPKYFTTPWIVVEDEEAIKRLGLTKLYEEMAYLDDLKGFFSNNYPENILEKLNKLSSYTRMQVFLKLKEMVKNKEFVDMEVRDLIQDNYAIDIFEK